MKLVGNANQQMRNWVAWTIVSIWAGTALGVFVAAECHPATTINGSLTVSELPVLTNASRILAATDDVQLAVSGVSAVEIEGQKIQVSQNGEAMAEKGAVSLRGDAGSTCTFSSVHSDGLRLSGASAVRFVSRVDDEPSAFAIESHGEITGNLTSQAGTISGFVCTQVTLAGEGKKLTLEGRFAPEGGDSVLFSSWKDTTISLHPTTTLGIRNTQIPILGEIRLSKVDRDSLEEKSVLASPDSGSDNKVIFERLEKTIKFDPADMLVIKPAKYFYVREFVLAKNGLRVSFHGVAEDVIAGAGPEDLHSRMPSLLDQLVHEKEIFGLVPAIVAVLIGILEKIGALPK
jgi:hypothetical protein